MTFKLAAAGILYFG